MIAPEYQQHVATSHSHLVSLLIYALEAKENGALCHPIPQPQCWRKWGYVLFALSISLGVLATILSACNPSWNSFSSSP